ncbi:MAG: DUF5367 family protein [Alphaproteobacteria bacterium]|nr:DUF5367 family protein [Alphaproteobacteria bacterium]
MILKSAGVGLLLWLVATLAIRFFGQLVFFPGDMQMLILLVATPIVVVPLTVLVLGLLGEAPSDRAEAAIGLAFPGMLLDAIAVNEFETVFPNLDPTLAGSFGAVMLVGYASILLTGLYLTRLAPKDERL